MNIKNYKIDLLNYCKHCEYNCEIVCPVYKLSKKDNLKPKNKAIKALDSLKSWDFSNNIDFYACINCNFCSYYCPHKTPIGEILEYIKEKVIISDNASDEILQFEEFFYKELEKLRLIKKYDYTIIKNIPDFLVFYNLGFRDETITELKTILRKITTEKVLIEDISFVYLINKVKKQLKKVKIPQFLFPSHDKKDYVKIILSGLEITNVEIYNLFINKY